MGFLLASFLNEMLHINGLTKFQKNALLNFKEQEVSKSREVKAALQRGKIKY